MVQLLCKMVWWFLNKLTTELSYDPAPVYMLTLALLWTVAHQAPLSMRFSRQAYLSGLPFPPPRYLPTPGTEPGSPALQADSLLSELQGKPNFYFHKISPLFHFHNATQMCPTLDLPRKRLISSQLYRLVATLGQCPLYFTAECIQKCLKVSTGNWFQKERFGGTHVNQESK